MRLNYCFVRDKLLQENNSKLDLASQETIPSALRFAENLPKPNGLTNMLEYERLCARFTIDNISIVTQP